MARDAKKRAGLCEVEINGITFVHCDRVTGVSKGRRNFTYIDAQGDEIPMAGGNKMTTIELHGCHESDADFWAWINSPNPDYKAGAIHWKNQSKVIVQTATFSDALPNEIAMDDHDRKTDDVHGATRKIDCIIRSIS